MAVGCKEQESLHGLSMSCQAILVLGVGLRRGKHYHQSLPYYSRTHLLHDRILQCRGWLLVSTFHAAAVVFTCTWPGACACAAIHLLHAACMYDVFIASCTGYKDICWSALLHHAVHVLVFPAFWMPACYAAVLVSPALVVRVPRPARGLWAVAAVLHQRLPVPACHSAAAHHC